MEPPQLLTEFEKKKFWKDTLFDFNFAPAVIDIASSYQYRWSDIIPDLYRGRFGEQNSHFSNALPPYFCEETLKRLSALAIHRNKNNPLTNKLRESLASDGFDLAARWDSDVTVPTELAGIPGLDVLTSDLSTRLKAGELIAVLYMDLDGFKEVNDTLRHAAGNECLIRVARTMASAILNKGKLYRYGGDEFVALLPNFSRDEAAATAERIRATIDSDNPGASFRVTVSIGVASSEAAGEIDAKSFIDIADKAMYESKAAGGNRVTRAAGRNAEPESVAPRLTPAQVQNRIAAVDLELSIQQGISELFIVNVENESEETVTVKKIKISHEGVKLAETPPPGPKDDWVLGPRLRRQIEWNARNPDPAIKLMDLLHIYTGVLQTTVDVDIQAEVLGTLKNCHTRIHVQVEPGSKRIWQL